jgi:methanogenic corrinoid protein MtbC1
VSQKWAVEIGADGYGANAELAVKLVKSLTGSV